MEKGKLYADLSNKTGMHMVLVPETETKFFLPDVQRILTTVEFIMKDGKVTGIFFTQEKPYAFDKID
jgi:hypothetical protein